MPACAESHKKSLSADVLPAQLPHEWMKSTEYRLPQIHFSGSSCGQTYRSSEAPDYAAPALLWHQFLQDAPHPSARIPAPVSYPDGVLPAVTPPPGSHSHCECHIPVPPAIL